MNTGRAKRIGVWSGLKSDLRFVSSLRLYTWQIDKQLEVTAAQLLPSHGSKVVTEEARSMESIGETGGQLPDSTKQDTPDRGVDGAGLSCPGSSVVAENRAEKPWVGEG
jgi:hypothetical protein